MAKFIVVYDNNKHHPALRAAWGFACWVETGKTTLLFDTGGDGTILLSNLAKLKLDPQMLDAIVLSHAHGDHTGGLARLLGTGIKPTVYAPAAFPAPFKADVQAQTNLVQVTGPADVAPGVRATGPIGSGIVEQALVVQTGMGWAVLTGCAHPGIAEMVRRAQELTVGEIALVMGGFHLGAAGKRQVEVILAQFQQMGVQRVAPGHCTGDRARRQFAQAYGANCTLIGVGNEIEPRETA